MRTAKEEFLNLISQKVGTEKFKKIKNDVSLYYDINCNDKSEWCNEKQLAEYEFYRFRNMSESILIDFFAEYQERHNLLVLKSIADNLAMLRINEGTLISREEYCEKCKEITEAAKDLILQDKYKAWTEKTVKDATGSLKYASGKSNIVNKNILIKGGKLL